MNQRVSGQGIDGLLGFPGSEDTEHLIVSPLEAPRDGSVRWLRDGHIASAHIAAILAQMRPEEKRVNHGFFSIAARLDNPSE
jgi:hypothetical protein